MGSALVLENDRIRLMFSGTNGALIGLEDLQRSFSHLDGAAKEPFRLHDIQRDIVTGDYCFCAETDKDRIRLTWKGEREDVEATVTLLEDGAIFRARMVNHGGSSAATLEYPRFEGLTDLHEETYLAHAWATGVKMQNPATIDFAGSGLEFVPYPECFSGCSMQLMNYYHQDKAGLYMAAHDGDGHLKWLNSYVVKHGETNVLVMSHSYGQEDLRKGASIEMPYDFVLRLLPGHGWEEAADLYREFALKQSWCARGPLAERTWRPEWLHKEVGYCTFGIAASYDRSKWLKAYHRDIGRPGFHVLGPDWANEPADFMGNQPGGLNEWFPTRFSQETLRAIRENGDRFAPFEFDFIFKKNCSDGQAFDAVQQRFPEKPLSHDRYKFNMMCPCEDFTRDFHRERDVMLWKESHMDGIYYDISANNLIRVCLREDHNHIPGGGKQINDGYREIYRNTQEALCKEAGTYVAMGTEMMCEVFLDRLDFYQARAWGQPCSTLETWPVLGCMWSGQAEMIPMFDHVYHEFGVVRMDGWGKLVNETGSVFYDTVAKTYLWGALFEINAEYSPMEELEGVETTAEEHYFRFSPRHYAYSAERGNYIGQFAAARLGCANDYWAYGQMLTVPDMEIASEEKWWYHYNHNLSNPTYQSGGKIRLPLVRTSYYKAPNGKHALFLAVTSDETVFQTLPLEAMAKQHDGKQAKFYTIVDGKAELYDDFGTLTCETVDMVVRLDGKSLYMLETC